MITCDHIKTANIFMKKKIKFSVKIATVVYIVAFIMPAKPEKQVPP